MFLVLFVKALVILEGEKIKAGNLEKWQLIRGKTVVFSGKQ